MSDKKTADNWRFAQIDLANDELERLRAEIERLKAALRLFCEADYYPMEGTRSLSLIIPIEDWRSARDVLGGKA